MVDQSERAFRLLCRELGTELCYTPMIHARLYNEVPTFRDLHFDPHPSDRPLIAQFAGHDPDTVLTAAQKVADQVDAVDLNFGCPQGIARKGRYGAFLLDEPDVMVALVRKLADELTVPVTVKLRLLPSRPASIELCQRLEEAGASVLCLHGRTRDQNKQYAGKADWAPIREVVSTLSIPVIANGGIATRADVDACVEYTGAAAVMSSEALLENPALFCSNVHPVTGEYLDQTALARRYLQICEEHPPAKGAAIVRGHLFKFLHNGLREHTDMRDELLLARTLPEMGSVVERMEAAGWTQPNFHAAAAGAAGGEREEHAGVSWYQRHPRTDLGAGDVGAASTRVGSARERDDLLVAQTEHGKPEQSREDIAAAALEKRAKKSKEKRQRRQRKREAGLTRKQRHESKVTGLQTGAASLVGSGGGAGGGGVGGGDMANAA